MIKVVHLQNSMKSAGSAALRLHNSFIEYGINSNIVSLFTDKLKDDKIKYLNKKARIISRLDTEVKKYVNRNIIPTYGSFSFPVFGTDVSTLKEINNADIIYLHWVLGGFLNLSNVRKLLKLKKNVVIFMHDMWWITGGCHHSFSCEKYTLSCNNCQMIKGNRKKDISALEFNKKLKLYSKFDNVYFVSPSKWLYDCAKNSKLTRDSSIFYIPNTIDTSFYKPFDKKVARNILNISPEETVIAFGAVKINSPYKGWSYLQKALEILKNNNNLNNILILIFGDSYNKEIDNAIPFKTKFMGYLQDEYSTALAYNSADIFIAPSLAETFGYVVMEALSCGTPVVGFEIGGIPDLISHKKNGYLAKYKDSEDIANGINYCLENKLKGYILPEFEPNKTLKKHLELFDFIRSNSKK